jgi:hypothetical protein
MKRARFATALLAALLSFPALGAVSGRGLLDGKPVTVAPGKAGTVVAFLSAKCPCSNSHVPLLKELAKEYPEFSFVAVHANADEPPGTAVPYFQAAAFPFPVIQDEKQKLADELRAYKTPHVFVLTPDGKTAYKGGATNSADAAHASKFYLRDALADLRAGRPVKVPEGRTLGCVIAR